MRRFLISLSLILLAVAAPERVFPQGADTSDLFLNAYMANEQGQQIENSGDAKKALSKYRYAASLLDQISRDDPRWQPIVVDYRKKRVSENIARLEKQLSTQAAAEPSAIEGALPQKEENNPGITETAAPPTAASGPSQQIRDQIDQLQNDLRESRQKLKSVENEKEDLAGRLNDALKQIDRTKVSEAELKGQLKQVQDAYQNSLSDHSQTAGAQKEYQARITQLENALKDTEADRDAADEENSEYARRANKAHQNTEAIVQQRDAANAHAKDLEVKYADASKLATQLAAAKKQIAAVTKERDDATDHADDLDKQLADAKQASARQIEQLTKATEAQVADAKKGLPEQIEQLTEDRDTARQQITTLNGKLDDAKKQIASVTAERDEIAAQRDQALADLGKAREAAKHVEQLLADNASLRQKLATDEKTIQDYKAGSPEKDKQIADLRKQVSDTKALLTASQQARDNAQNTLSELQQQYDTTSTELTELKANNKVNGTEKQTLTDENDLLRGIVLRQLKEQAHRDQTKRLVMSELSQLQVQSDALLTQINYLGQPVVQLTDKERALFKDPSLDIPEADDTTMSLSIAAPKQGTATHETAVAAASPSPAAETAAASPAPEGSPAASSPSAAPIAPMAPTTAASSPSATPTEMASRTTPGKPEGALSPAPSAPSAATEKPASASATSTGTGLTPMVPPELMEDARTAKESFERAEYRDAEKTYEKMLTKAPNNVYILSNLGVVYFRNQKWKLAEESLQKAIAVAPEDTFSHCTLGIVYYQEKRYDDAINSLTRALAINPKYAVAHNYLGITASQKGWAEAAKKELETAVELDPNYADAYFNLAVVYAMQQPPDKQLAGKYYKRAVDLGAEPDSGLEQLVK